MKQQTVEILGKTFEKMIDAQMIQATTKNVAKGIAQFLHEREDRESIPLFVVVLNGAFMFASDVLKCITIPCEVAFIRVKSYDGTERKEIVDVMGIKTDVQGRDVIILEDIVDSGATINFVVSHLKARSPRTIKIATLLFKEEVYNAGDYGVHIINWPAFVIQGDPFVVGRGLDYNDYGRNLADIYQIVKS